MKNVISMSESFQITRETCYNCEYFYFLTQHLTQTNDVFICEVL